MTVMMYSQAEGEENKKQIFCLHGTDILVLGLDVLEKVLKMQLFAVTVAMR